MDERLRRLASLYGIEPGYHDIWGNWHEASSQTHRALLAAMGVDLADDAALDRALDHREVAPWRRAVAPVTVVRASRLGEGVRINLGEASTRRALSWRIVQEDGQYREERFDPVTLGVLEEFQRGALSVRAYRLRLPVDLPEGYHRLAVVENGAPLAEGVLIVAPERCYLPPQIADGARVWGPAVQLYGVRSERNAGIGDFGDLRQAVETWGKAGAALVGTNPLHALSPREPAKASPYSPSSRLFLNALYLDIEAIEDFRELAAKDEAFGERWRAACPALREPDLVDYPRVAAEKRAMLEALYANFSRKHLSAATRRSRDFARYRDVQGLALRRHAIHEALAEFHAMSWRQWPAEHRDPASEAVDDLAEEHAERVTFHEYLQWQADIQLSQAQARARELGMAIGLYADLAISIDGGGSESWANQGLYAIGAGVGAPPDEFNTKGQDWGLAPLHPLRLAQGAYAGFVATLRANMERAGALRVDHVMGLTRLWWVPVGLTPSLGAYVRYPLDDLLAILALESHRNRCMVIGEDLGTVPGDFRERMDGGDVLSYRLLLFEREGAGFKPPAAFPRKALVAWSTHDLPTLAGWWRGHDLDTRESLELATAQELAPQREERSAARVKLTEILQRDGFARHGQLEGDDDEAIEALVLAVHGYLARTSAMVLVVQMEDVLGLTEQANVPGTIDQHPNWRRKLPLPLERWAADARVKHLSRALASSRGMARSRRDLPPGLTEARIPRATYRVQLHADFNFAHVTSLVPYLARLGVSHLYCSPYLLARPGSRHGYDIIDHDAINPEIGAMEDLERLAAELERHGMAQMMDVVPNHMGVLAADNAWWQDVLENGPSSVCADYFDIDWQPPSEHLANRVLLPVLGDHYGVELAGGKLVLHFEPETGSFAIRYFEHRLPIEPREYPRILVPAARELENAGGDAAHDAQRLRSIADAFANLPPRGTRERSRLDERNLGKEVAKGRLGMLARSTLAAEAIGRAVAAVNGRVGDPSSFDMLHDLLEAQAFRLAYWRVAQDEINYRRFFDINDLAALRQEHPAVFDATHRLVRSLVARGIVHALRIDHPDGLYDPRAYFHRLQEACGKAMYVAVEKIVAPFENVPEDWAVHGTTGYRFANVVNGLFVDPSAEARITRAYHQFTGDASSFEEVGRRSRRLVLRTALASELTMLTSRLARISRSDRSTRDFTFTTLRDGLAEVLSAFPVYRTYIDDTVRNEDRHYIEWAVAKARQESRSADVGVFDFIRDALTGELPARSPAVAAAIRHFARKFQQVSAPVMAKGLEDTALYNYNRLASLNDVGGDPAEFGFPAARFHKASAHRARRWPHTMLATSTHDNKRSEDVRARIDVLSEMAAGWRLQLRKWTRMNAHAKSIVDQVPAPSRNDEYLLYQVMLGSFPAGNPHGAALRAYRDRIVAYMQKAGREAKAHTSWVRVNEPYEAATTAFIHALLDEARASAFLQDFRAAARAVTWIGYLNSLSMAAIKFTSPGVPDCYQGNETWDFSLVDPDNRRPVDYGRRSRMLAELEAMGEANEARVAGIFRALDDGRSKLYVTWRLLQLRKEREALFRDGSYTAVRVAGEKARHLVAFARRQGREAVVTLAPRLFVGLGIQEGALPCGAEVWGDTRIDLPFFEAGTVLRDALTGRTHTVQDGGLRAADVLAVAPVAVLVRSTT